MNTRLKMYSIIHLWKLVLKTVIKNGGGKNTGTNPKSVFMMNDFGGSAGLQVK